MIYNMDELIVRLAERLKLEHSYALNPDCVVEIKQEQERVEIFPGDVNSLQTETDLGIVVKSEDQSCMNCETSRDNLPSENGQFSKECYSVEVVQGSETLELEYNCVVEETLVNDTKQEYVEILPEDIKSLQTDKDNLPSKNEQFSKECCSVEVIQVSESLELDYNSVVKGGLVNEIDYEHEIPRYFVSSKCKRDYESAFNPLAKVRQSTENALGGKILAQQKLLDKSEDEKGTLQNGATGLKPMANSSILMVTDTNTIEAKIQKTLDNRQKSGVRRMNDCWYCDYETNREYNLKMHISKIHEREGIPELTCSQCACKKFGAYNLYMHLLKHVETKDTQRYKCLGCEKYFHQKMHLDTHLLDHHEDLQHLIKRKIHSCNLCTYKTFTKSDLYRHGMCKHCKIDIGNTGKPKEEFSDRNSDSHIVNNRKGDANLVTVARKTYRCLYCTYITLYGANLLRHIRTKHKDKHVLYKIINKKNHQLSI